MWTKRTDLAVEAKEIWKESAEKTTELKGVKSRDTEDNGFKITTVEILDDEGAQALNKPVGTYITMEIDKLVRREDNAFTLGAETLGRQIAEIMKLGDGDSVLVVGLGNDAITPDAIGPQTAKNTMVTRHLVEKMPEEFGSVRRVSVLVSGVLGTTGIESAEFIKAVAERLKPNQVIVVDALASRKLARVCRTVQLADTGIVPGSGVGNSRAAISKETLGVPVTAIGVPTVVDAGTLAADLAEQAGAKDLNPEDLSQFGGSMIVTPKEIDNNVSDISKLIGYGINLALHKDLEIEDINMFLS
ncbi:spore protease [Sporobacter termitidis DSM 10068]|uniref:Germination protease n=1 Tax=Sporobacter termitidis DSM 10068 TaxID=1123282 RepID=A0A1M5VVH0_9FIRM|nr:GPR endopeptidase [Sporobacter termitidis]SHH78933.1 spore protease [Sporobacter termitidis DSM 10068]